MMRLGIHMAWRPPLGLGQVDSANRHCIGRQPNQSASSKRCSTTARSMVGKLLHIHCAALANSLAAGRFDAGWISKGSDNTLAVMWRPQNVRPSRVHVAVSGAAQGPRTINRLFAPRVGKMAKRRRNSTERKLDLHVVAMGMALGWTDAQITGAVGAGGVVPGNTRSFLEWKMGKRAGWRTSRCGKPLLARGREGLGGLRELVVGIRWRGFWWLHRSSESQSGRRRSGSHRS